jgi:DNA invertase Pin-like site-specific DNA recombinase
MKRATIYARASTKDQSVEMQLIDLRGYARSRGFKNILTLLLVTGLIGKII